MAFVPSIAKQVLATDDPLEQVKLGVALICSSFHNSILWRSPLSGLLGETASYRLGEDCDIYIEQISMKPSTFLIYGKGPGYTISGHLTDSLEIGSGGATVKNTGDIRVTFDNTGVTIIGNPGHVVMSGLVGKNKKFRANGDAFIICKEKGIFAQMTFCPEKKKMLSFMSKTPDQDKVQGAIYKIPDELMDHIVEQKPPRTAPKLKDGMDGVSLIGEIKGLWTKEVDIAGL